MNLRHAACVSSREGDGEQHKHTNGDDAKPRLRQSALIQATGRKEQHRRRRDNEARYRQCQGTTNGQEQCDARRGDSPDAEEWIHDRRLTLTLTGRGERMRASGRVVRTVVRYTQHHLTKSSARDSSGGEIVRLRTTTVRRAFTRER